MGQRKVDDMQYRLQIGANPATFQLYLIIQGSRCFNCGQFLFSFFLHTFLRYYFSGSLSSEYYYVKCFTVLHFNSSHDKGQCSPQLCSTWCTIFIFSYMNEIPPFHSKLFFHIFFKLCAHGRSHILRLCHTQPFPLCASPTQ